MSSKPAAAARRTRRRCDVVSVSVATLSAVSIFCECREFAAAAPPRELRSVRYAAGVSAFDLPRSRLRPRPNILPTSLQNAPVNGYLPTFPADAALARMQMTQDATGLRRLGVAQVILRCGFETAPYAVVAVRRRPETSCIQRSLRITDPQPMLSVLHETAYAALDQGLRHVQLFSEISPEIQTISYEPRDVDPSLGWTDARLSAASVYEAASSLGGVFTHSKVPLLMKHLPWLLVWGEGEIQAKPGQALPLQGHFEWWHVPQPDGGITCTGTCQISAQALHPFYPLEGSSISYEAVPIHCYLPWLCFAHAAMTAQNVLELNQSYDRGWIALGTTGILRHVRIDGISNGFQAGSTFSRGDLAIFHYPSAIESAAELFALCYLLRYMLKSGSCLVKRLSA